VKNKPSPKDARALHSSHSPRAGWASALGRERRARGEARGDGLEPRAQRRHAHVCDERGGEARRAQEAALAGEAAVDPLDPARVLELGGGLGLALEKERRVGGGAEEEEAARDERVGLAELARGRLGAQTRPEGLGGGGVAVGGGGARRGGSRRPGAPASRPPRGCPCRTSRSGASAPRGG
jgi:hypothetical protein